MLIGSIIFLVTFIPIRTYGGGLHLSSYLTCF
ncbi:accessory gene regulator B family protein [Lacrimispora sp.]